MVFRPGGDETPLGRPELPLRLAVDLVDLAVAVVVIAGGAALEDAEAHLARWGLQPPERVRQHVAFVLDPRWRTYLTTYVEGARLVGDWLAARPARQPVGGRFVRLLDEQLTPAALQAELT